MHIGHFACIMPGNRNRHVLKDSNALTPSIRPRIDHDFVGKGIRISRRYWWNVVFLPIHDIDDFLCISLQVHLHRFPGLVRSCDPTHRLSASPFEPLAGTFCLTHLIFCSGQGNVQNPLFPTHVVLSFSKAEVRLSPLLLKEPDRQLSPRASIASITTACASPVAVSCLTVHLSHQGRRALVDERLQVDIIDGGEGDVKEIAGEWTNGGEVPVKKDGMEEGFDDVFEGKGIREDFEDVLGGPTGFHRCVQNGNVG